MCKQFAQCFVAELIASALKLILQAVKPFMFRCRMMSLYWSFLTMRRKKILPLLEKDTYDYAKIFKDF